MMLLWSVVGLSGATLAAAGALGLARRYSREEISLGTLVAWLVGFASFASYAVLVTFMAERVTGLVGLLVLLPAFVCLVVLVHRHGRTAKTP